MQVADNTRRETLTPRTGAELPQRPEDTSGGAVLPRTNRRDFLKWGLFGSLLLMLGGFWQAVLMFFYPKKLSPFGSKLTVPGTVADYPEGSVTPVREGKFYVSHVPEGLLALYWKCVHLGCTVPWKPTESFEGEEGIFRCPCHGSIYLRNGQNVAGPAPRPLDVMEIELTGNKIVVNTKKITKRVRWEPSQATKLG